MEKTVQQIKDARFKLRQLVAMTATMVVVTGKASDSVASAMKFINQVDEVLGWTLGEKAPNMERTLDGIESTAALFEAKTGLSMADLIQAAEV